MAKTSIFISGQISGNFTLASAIGGERLNTCFNGIILCFDTKKEAIKAIRDAYNSLANDEPEMKGRLGGVRANKDRTELYYDASKAEILKD